MASVTSKVLLLLTMGVVRITVPEPSVVITKPPLFTTSDPPFTTVTPVKLLFPAPKDILPPLVPSPDTEELVEEADDELVELPAVELLFGAALGLGVTAGFGVGFALGVGVGFGVGFGLDAGFAVMAEDTFNTLT